MKTIVIDGGMFSDKDQAHRYIARRLSFPEYYGRNLDALYDCLCDISEPLCLVLYNRGAMRERLGTYYRGMMSAFFDADAHNENINILLDEEEPQSESQTGASPEKQ